MNNEMMNKMNPVIEEICDKCCPYAKAVNAGQMDEETFEAHCAGALDCPSINLMDAAEDVIAIEQARRQEEQDTEMGEHYDRLCAAASHFGIDAQLRKTREELVELYVAIGDELDGDEEEPRPDRDHTLEEIADVYNMLDQLCIIWDAEDAVWDKCIRKMVRTVERIESGYYEEAEDGNL